MADYENYVAKGQGMRDSLSGWADKIKNFAGEAGKYSKGVMQGLMEAPDPNAAFKGQGLDPEINAVGKSPPATTEASPALRSQAPQAPGRFEAPAKPFNPIPEAGGAGTPPPTTPPPTTAPAAGAPKDFGKIPGAVDQATAAARRAPTYINTGTTGAQAPSGYAEVNPAAEAKAAPKTGVRNLSSGKLPGILAVAGEAMDPNVRAAVNPESGMSGVDRLKQASRSALRVGGGILGGVAGSAAMPILGTVAGGYAGYKAGDYVADQFFGEQQNPALRSQTPVAQTQAQAEPAAPPGGYGGPGNAGLREGQTMPAGYGVVRNNRTGQTTNIGNKSFDGLGSMPDNATPEQAAAWLKKTNTINQGRAAENMQRQAQGGQGGGDELRPLRDLAAMDAGAAPGSSGFGSMAALGAYGALDRMKSNAANLGLRQQQIQATNNLAQQTRAQAQANTDREFANKVGEQNQKSIETENADYAKRGVVASKFESSLPGGKADKAGYDQAVQQATADRQAVFKRSAAAAGVDPNNMSAAQRQRMHLSLNIRQQVLGNRDDGLADYFKNSQVDSDVAQSFEPKSVEPADRFGEQWIVTTQNGNRIPLKAFQGGQFQWTGSNKPINGEFAALTEKLIEAHKSKSKSKG